MDQRLTECLENRQGSYILPFFWQHGEEHARLLEEMEAIAGSNVREFCVESRIHEQFGQEAWWKDMGFILEEARKRHMKVWLLDDKRFPSGYANDILRRQYPHLRKRGIREVHMDFLGPLSHGVLPSYGRFNPETERLLGIYAFKRSGKGESLCGGPVELTGFQRDGLLYWEIPDGVWRVFWIIDTDASPDCYRDYLDMLHPDSCRLMLETVYEPHYAHFAPYFGNTFQGFFSDEPCFGNDAGTYDSKLGRPGMVLPFRDTLLPRLAEAVGAAPEKAAGLLPALWYDCEGISPRVRTSYMDIITKAYSQNFGWMLGDWCRAHGVKYIGHVIEDMNAHMRTGYGAGHFFRALDGQDMAGIDIVLNQWIPGLTDTVHTASIAGGVADPAFFNYTLAKLAASHSHLQPLKRGRAMCEIFGAFGWAEGLPMMKRMADHMLVNGINHFVPHAFSPRCPDGDCPPHFYAGGTNPQFPLFGELTAYMQRMSHMLAGGLHKASAAVFYNAEAEWAGGEYMLFQEVCRALTRGFIDFDVVHEDLLQDGAAQVREGKLWINGEAFGALAVAYSERLPAALLKTLAGLARQGLDVVFVGGLCKASCEGSDVGELNALFHTLPLDGLVSWMRERGHFELQCEPFCPDLRFYHIQRDGGDVYMFYNQSLARPADVRIHLPSEGPCLFYDAFQNRVSAAQAPDGWLPLYLPGGCSALVVFDGSRKGGEGTVSPPLAPAVFDGKQTDGKRAESLTPALRPDREMEASGTEWEDFQISLCPAGEEEFSPYGRFAPDRLPDLTADPAYSRFCGTIRYETAFRLEGRIDGFLLDLGQVGETAQVWVNGVYCGAAIQAPYRFRLPDVLRPGGNRLAVEAVNSPAYRERDYFSGFLPFPPSGLLGPVRLLREKD
ncbi:MAG: glycosyl transferase family 2 [Clostridiales bacterium]|nr:glycosyl transferase family 2 [Clostridiales bacterium]